VKNALGLVSQMPVPKKTTARSVYIAETKRLISEMRLIQLPSNVLERMRTEDLYDFVSWLKNLKIRLDI
jgi:hypothetical protein